MIDGLTIADVLPHAPPMILLDEVLEKSAEQVSCAVTIRPDTLFCDGVNGVPSWVGLEYMAQTLSTYVGIVEARQGIKPSIGLLLGSRRYRAEVPYFPVGARLRIVATLELLDDTNLAAFGCQLYRDAGAEQTLWARGDIKAYRPKDVLAVLRGERI